MLQLVVKIPRKAFFFSLLLYEKILLGENRRTAWSNIVFMKCGELFALQRTHSVRKGRKTRAQLSPSSAAFFPAAICLFLPFYR